MEPVIPALHALGRGVGDVLPTICPPHLVALTLHQGNEFFLAGGESHALVDGVQQAELPALAFDGGAVLPGAHTLGLFFLLLRQDRESMLSTQLIRQLPQAAKGIRPLPEHFAALPAHRVDDEVGMDVFGVQVGGDQHLTVWPGFCGELFSQLLGLLPSDHLIRRKGLDVVVKPHGTLLVVHIPRGLELLADQWGRAVLPADQLAAVFIQCFLILRHILRYATEGTGRLFLVFDEGDRGHQRFSCSARSRS